MFPCKKAWRHLHRKPTQGLNPQGVKANLNDLENLLNDPEAGVQLLAAVIVEVGNESPLNR
ncbi:hypothetical protein DKY63_11070 [Pseudomonas putida]|uniref:Uncharacterized protein n=1 Tax=Pseudomonas putida TaxID=303 RepID=A0A2Z4RH68_PSEPU|nr:hypothetical protein DKY63_11070 [Pseudomonas putida]